MIKRILSVVICVLMVAAVCAVSASAASPVELKVSTNVTNAKVGDVLDYQVAMAPVSGVGSIQFQIVIPEGMSFVEGSVIDKSAIGFDSFELTATSMIVNGYASTDYSSDSATVLANFKLKVNDDAAGTLTVGLDSVEIGSCETFEVYETYVQSSSVAIDGDTPVDPTEEPTVAPTTAPTTAPTVAPTEKATEKATVAPTQKATSAKNTDSTKAAATKDSTSPKTSDSGMIFVWIGLFALAILGVAGTFVFKKVRK